MPPVASSAAVVSAMARPGTPGTQWIAEGLTHTESGTPSSRADDHVAPPPDLGPQRPAGVVVAAQPFVVPNAPKFPLSTEPHVYDTADQKIRVTVVAHGIPRPWALLPLPDGDMLVSVRAAGQVLAIRKGVLDPKPLTGLPAMHLSRPTGMLDMALHPRFAENRLIYFTYHKPLGGNTWTLALARGHAQTRRMAQTPPRLPLNRTLSLSPDVNRPEFRAVTWDQVVAAVNRMVATA